ncbi:MAG: SDR family oxidoreductase [Proteobacteria bacterium]|nr:SDR family oxidoreductase [Pseudomonadota bacterium]MBU2574290.1 SDR family oxidoreductase [Elusimicrobiota bacterium]
MKCIVTGGAGFIGGHMVDALLEAGHEVTVLDNLSTGRLENLAHHKEKAGLRFAQADITELEAIRPLFNGMDWVFHLAALADIVPSIVDPVGYYRSNVLGTMHVLECARLSGVRRFIYAASSSCYGIAGIYPTPESGPAAPEYPYALTKHLGEQTALHWNRVYKLPLISLRLFNVYGPRSRTSGAYGAVFGVFLAQKLAGKPFTVVGDGTQTRDFVFVTDVARAFLAAAGSSVNGEIFNVGSGKPQSVNRLVELLGGPVTHLPKRPGEPDITHAEVSRIRAALGWEAQVSFEQGVRVMLDNIDYWRSAAVWSPEGIAGATRDWFRYLGGSK